MAFIISVSHVQADQIHLVGQYIIIRSKCSFNINMIGNTFVSKANEKSATKHVVNNVELEGIN